MCIRDSLGGIAAHGHGDAVQDGGPGDEVGLLGGLGLGVAAGLAAGDDGNFMHRVAVGQHLRHQGVAGLVVGHELAVAFGHLVAALLRAQLHAVDGLGDVAHGDFALAPPGGQERGLVEHVLQVRAGKVRRNFGQHVQLDVGRERLAPCVHLED